MLANLVRGIGTYHNDFTIPYSIHPVDSNKLWKLGCTWATSDNRYIYQLQLVRFCKHRCFNASFYTSINFYS